MRYFCGKTRSWAQISRFGTASACPRRDVPSGSHSTMNHPESPFSDAKAVADYTAKPPRLVPGLAGLQRMTTLLLAEHTPATGRVLVLGAGGGLLKEFANAHMSPSPWPPGSSPPWPKKRCQPFNPSSTSWIPQRKKPCCVRQASQTSACSTQDSPFEAGSRMRERVQQQGQCNTRALSRLYFGSNWCGPTWKPSVLASLSPNQIPAGDL